MNQKKNRNLLEKKDLAIFIKNTTKIKIKTKY